MTDNLPARLMPPLPGETGRSHWRITPLGVEMVEELASRGCHVTTIAAALGMSRDGWMACRKRQPEVEEAYQRGLAVEHDKLVAMLHEQAAAGQYVPAMFLLKARHGYREGEAVGVNLQVNTGGVLVVPHRQSVEDFLRDNPADAQPVRDPDLIEGRIDPATRRGD